MRTAIFLFLAASFAVAQPTEFPELKLTDGTVYSSVTVTAVQPDGLKISHESGMAKIPFEKLPVEVAKKFNFDEAGAREFRANEAVAQKESAAKMQATAETIRQKNAVAAKLAELEKNSEEIQIEIIQVTSKGAMADPLKTKAITSSLGSVGGGGYATASYHRSGKRIFIEGIKGKTEGERVKCLASKNGSYEFVDTEGAQRTVEKWIFFKELEQD